MENKTKAVEAQQVKVPKSYEKFIWLAVSAVIALIGGIFRANGTILPTVPKVIYIAFLLFTSIMVAQKTSNERLYYAEFPEQKKKYLFLTFLYYVFVFLTVFYVFFSMWIGGILSI